MNNIFLVVQEHYYSSQYCCRYLCPCLGVHSHLSPSTLRVFYSKHLTFGDFFSLCGQLFDQLGLDGVLSRTKNRKSSLHLRKYSIMII